MRDSCPVGASTDHMHIGDPAGMEQLASELTLRAESIAGITTSLARQVEGMTFEGPVADRLRLQMEERRRRAEQLATELQGAARTLRRSAATVREEIHEIEIAAARARDEEP